MMFDHLEKNDIDIACLQECRFHKGATNWMKRTAKIYGYTLINGQPQYNAADACYGGLLTLIRGRSVRKVKCNIDDTQVLMTQMDRGNDTRPCLVVNVHIEGKQSNDEKFSIISKILQKMEGSAADAIILGDWNLEPAEAPVQHQAITGRMRLLTDELQALNPTRRDANGPTGKHVDYGAVVGAIEAGNAAIIHTDYESDIGSDHEMIAYKIEAK